MSKEHAYAYEAGYRDGSVNYELEHCPACKNITDLQEALDENSKLRELCKRFAEYVSPDCCEGCCVKKPCRDGYIEECWQLTDIRKLGHELGIEVD